MNNPVDINSEKIDVLKNNIFELTNILNNLYDKDKIFVNDINLDINKIIKDKEILINKKEIEDIILQLNNIKSIENLKTYNNDIYNSLELFNSFVSLFERKKVSKNNSILLSLASMNKISNVSNIYLKNIKESYRKNNDYIKEKYKEFISVNDIIDKSEGLLNLGNILNDIIKNNNNNNYIIDFKKYTNFYYVDIKIKYRHLMEIDDFLKKKSIYELMEEKFISKNRVFNSSAYNSFIDKYFDLIFYLKDKENINNSFILENLKIDNLIKLVKNYKNHNNSNIKNMIDFINSLPGFRGLENEEIPMVVYENYGFIYMQGDLLFEALRLLIKKEKNLFSKFYYLIKTKFVKKDNDKKILLILKYLEKNLDINKKETYIDTFVELNHYINLKNENIKLSSII